MTRRPPPPDPWAEDAETATTDRCDHPTFITVADERYGVAYRCTECGFVTPFISSVGGGK